MKFEPFGPIRSLDSGGQSGTKEIRSSTVFLEINQKTLTLALTICERIECLSERVLSTSSVWCMKEKEGEMQNRDEEDKKIDTIVSSTTFTTSLCEELERKQAASKHGDNEKEASAKKKSAHNGHDPME